MSDSVNRLSQEVNNAVNENLSGVQDYVNITLQVLYCVFPVFSFNLLSAGFPSSSTMAHACLVYSTIG